MIVLSRREPASLCGWTPHLRTGRNAPGIAGRTSRSYRAALAEPEVGVVLAPGGRLTRVLNVAISSGKIVKIDVIADSGTEST